MMNSEKKRNMKGKGVCERVQVDVRGVNPQKNWSKFLLHLHTSVNQNFNLSIKS